MCLDYLRAKKTRTLQLISAQLSSFVHLRREAGLAVVELLGRDRPLLLLHLLLLVQQELRLEAVAAAVGVAAVAARGLRSPGHHWRQHHWRAIHLTHERTEHNISLLLARESECESECDD